MLDPDVTVSIVEVERALDRVGRFGMDMGKIHEALRRPLMRDQREHRSKQTGPGGAWRPLSPFTIEKQKAQARRKGKRRPRLMLGKLPTAFKIEVTRQSLKLTSRVKWSGAHQEGNSADELPARPFFWLSPKVMREFVAIIEKTAGKTWMGMHL